MSSTLSEVLQNGSGSAQEIKAAVKREIHSAMPGIVKSYDPAKQTAVIQPAVRSRRRGLAYEDLPLLLDVPVVFPGSGALRLNWTLSEGDEVLVVFADSCIDGWFTHGGTQNPVVPRVHSLSDGFAIPGPRSLASSVPAPDSGYPFSIQMKNPQGQWITPLAITADGKIVITGNLIMQ